MNAFDPSPIQQLPVIQQEVLEGEEGPEPVGEEAAALPIEQEEQILQANTVPSTQVLEEPRVEVEDELLALVLQVRMTKPKKMMYHKLGIVLK
jgi:hypothetical protein